MSLLLCLCVLTALGVTLVRPAAGPAFRRVGGDVSLTGEAAPRQPLTGPGQRAGP
jgi:hypothetical protein